MDALQTTTSEQKKRPHLGMRLKLRRVELGLTIVEVEKKSGVSRSTVSRVEKNKPVSLNNFVAICQVLDVSPTALLCGSDQWNSEKVAM